MLFSHISDIHIDDANSLNTERLKLILAEISHVRPKPSLLLITGDLTQNARPAEYILLRELLKDHEPYLLVPGNHDDGLLVNRFFPKISPPQHGMLSIVIENNLRLLLIDSCVSNQDYGELSPQLLEDITFEIYRENIPTLLVMHHPPVPAQVPALDGMGLRNSSVFKSWLEEQDQILAVLAGHYHQLQFSFLGQNCRVPIIVAPSIASTLIPDFCTSQFEVRADAVGGLLHHWKQARLSTHFFLSRYQSTKTS